ncbi:hypothetical protein ALI22I_14400 [Saccharothrix sp. ALI-22-I]|uniref:hypothetical protein n=1 Tax=Saccharothrix sp. ALI-22-I TaxID=1933778 RepID=UPI00097BF4B0|nr:hypothetical protein [Saccharothrix sp. ALI-22-I]ONI89689.1 hypothetical protein ALI22I_14400 [Saccharothrix sp. ALI-22-I]
MQGEIPDWFSAGRQHWELLNAVLATHGVPVQWSPDRPEPATVEAVLDVLGSELADTGFDEADKATPRGRMLEELVDVFSEWHPDYR